MQLQKNQKERKSYLSLLLAKHLECQLCISLEVKTDSCELGVPLRVSVHVSLVKAHPLRHNCRTVMVEVKIALRNDPIIEWFAGNVTYHLLDAFQCVCLCPGAVVRGVRRLYRNTVEHNDAVVWAPLARQAARYDGFGGKMQVSMATSPVYLWHRQGTANPTT
jgi:hypothetical protein